MARFFFIIVFVFFFKSHSNGQIYYDDTCYYSPARLLFVPVEINHIKTLALIDAGSYKGIAVSSRLADSLHLVLSETNNTSTRYTGQSKELRGTISNFRLGEMNVPDVNISVVRNDIENISRQVRTDFDVILGWEFLSKYTVTVDYPAQKIRVEEKMPVTGKTPDWLFNFTVINKVPVVNGMLDDRPVKLLFDNGAPFCKLDTALNSSAINTIAEQKIGIASQVVPFTFRISDLKAIKTSPGCEAVIGNNFLEKYRVVISPKEQTISLFK